MTTVKVRSGVPDDYAPIWAINAAGQPGVSPFTAAELTALLATPGHAWVADAVDASTPTVAAYCIAYTSSEDYDGEEFAWFKAHYLAFLYIDQIAVATTQHRAGIGSQLYAAIEDVARAQNLPALTCEVNLVPPNPTSLA